MKSFEDVKKYCNERFGKESGSTFMACELNPDGRAQTCISGNMISMLAGICLFIDDIIEHSGIGFDDLMELLKDGLEQVADEKGDANEQPDIICS